MAQQKSTSMQNNPLIILASIVIIIAGLKLGSSVLAPILFAFTLTLLLSPLLSWLQKYKLPRSLAIFVVSLIFIIFLGVLITLIFVSANQLIDKLPEYENKLTTELLPLQQALQNFGIQPLHFIPTNVINGGEVARTALRILAGFVSNIVDVLFFLFTLLIMLGASEGISSKFKRQFNKNQSLFIHFGDWSKNIQNQYRIQSLSNFFSAIILTIILSFLKVDFSILWGVLIFVLAYIPNIGIAIASVPPILLAFIQYGWETAVLIALIFVLLNLIMDNVVTPKFMGEGLQVPAVVVFLSFIFWTWVFGLLGAFLALPATLAIRSLLLQNPNTRFWGELLSAKSE